MRKILILIVVLAAAGAGVWFWWQGRTEQPADELVLYGNIDFRQVQLAFNNSERIAEVLAEEGDRVSKGTPLARLDTGRLVPQVDQMAAQAAASARSRREDARRQSAPGKSPGPRQRRLRQGRSAQRPPAL